MATSYAPLHLRSSFSFAAAVSPPEAFVERAARWRLPALAIADEANLCGATAFFEAARGARVHPVLGATLRARGADVVLLVENDAGYANLCSLISARNLEEDFDLLREIPEHGEGLIALTADAALLRELVRTLDPDRIRAELIRPRKSLTEERRLLDAARETGARVVASAPALYVDEDEAELARVLAAIGAKKTVDSVEDRFAGRRLRPPDEMAHLFRDIPGALRSTLEVAERCRFDLLGRKTVFPRVASPARAAEMLRRAAREGARRLYGRISTRARQRLGRELALITRLGFADYFLVMADIVCYARALGSPTAGRGSGAGSLVAYALGITNVDPLRFDLPFERFLNPGREHWPDLDVDFCWRRRDEVIEYVYEKYGREHTAMVATYATFQPRSAFREVARAFGLDDEKITLAADALRRREPAPVERPKLERILNVAKRLEGLPHHLSVHCGGVVITPEPISTHAPLARAPKGVVITQFDKDAVERVGLVKLDLLGNRSLSTIAEAAEMVRARTGGAIEIDRLKEPDARVLALFDRADTIGCGQLESPAMRALFSMIRPRSAGDLMKVLALIRPGAAGGAMKETYVRRLRGLERPGGGDRLLAAILPETRGVVVYEDDVATVLGALCGLESTEADKFRRAIAKCRDDARRRALKERFLKLAARRGTSGEEARRIWEVLAKFNAYSFCRAHSASYARVAYASAYLKARHPLEFWVAALNNNASMYPAWVYIEEARRSGIPVLGPCVNRSGVEFSADGSAIRVGLGRIRELTTRSIEAILGARPFEGLADFLARSGVGVVECENLIRAGALDFCGSPRPRLVYQLRAHYKALSKGRTASGSLPGIRRDLRSPELPDYTEREKLVDEWRLLGLSFRGHPMSYRRKALSRTGVETSDVIPERIGRPVKLAGLLAAYRRYTPKGSDSPVLFVSLHDEGGIFEVNAVAAVALRARRRLRSLGPYVVTGRVESRHGALHVAAEEIEPLRRWPKAVAVPTA